jgi:hypothetical protein
MATPIITDPQEINSIRAYLGLEVIDFSDDSIQGLLFLQNAELRIRKTVNAMSVQTGGQVPTVDQIMADPPTSPATDDDQQALKMAVATYVAYLFGPSATNAINTSVTKKVGPLESTVDRGGIGAQWKEPMQIAYAAVGEFLSMITGWPDATATVLQLSGPTSSGARPDTVSGWWVGW